MKQAEFINNIGNFVKQLDKEEYKIKLLPFTNRHSCEVILPKKWEGKRVLIIKID